MGEIEDLRAENLRLRTQGLSEADRTRVLAQEEINAERAAMQAERNALALQAKTVKAQELSQRFRIPVAKLMEAKTVDEMTATVIDMTGNLLNDPAAIKRLVESAGVSGDGTTATEGGAPGANSAPAALPGTGNGAPSANKQAEIDEEFKGKGGDALGMWLAQTRATTPLQSHSAARPQTGTYTPQPIAAPAPAAANTPAPAPASAPAPVAAPAA